MAWAAGATGKLRENLVAWGLAEPINPRLQTDAGQFLGAFCDSYIKSRTDAKPNTIANFMQVRRVLCEYFGEQCRLDSITPSAAEKWRRWMTAERKLAAATASKHAKRAKTIFADAVGDRLLAVSPFAQLKCGSEVNPERQRFIDRAMAERILDSCPDADWRSIFALARFGGLRCPTEVLGLRWTDIDWAAGRIRIDSPKTGLRFCALFPELRELLWEASELAPEGAIYVVGRYRAIQNIRTQFVRIIERAGLVPWPKPFVNLRASRRTELQERFPSHVINTWLGQSTAIAEKHYLQTTDAHWQAAVEVNAEVCAPVGSPTGAPIKVKTDPLSQNQEMKKPRKNRGSDGWGLVVTTPKIPPRGLEPLLPD